MDYIIEILKYILLGIIQGITEIFPVSSSGHLTLFSHILKVDLTNLNVFLMLTNTGSFIALFFFFRKDIIQLIQGCYCYIFKKEEHRKDDFIYVLKLLVAVIPIGIFGLFVKDVLPSDLLFVGFMLLITSGLLFYVYQKRYFNYRFEITWKNAIVIGLFQMFAVFYGISRSGITMVGGLIQKIDLKKILKFSFLSYIVVSIPVSILGFYDALNAPEASINLVGYVLAFIMSFVFSLLAVSVLYKYVKVKNLIYFSIYCLVVAILSITLFFVL
jgi:undecaprenyl-diphosphatase